MSNNTTDKRQSEIDEDAARYRWLRDKLCWDVLPVGKNDDLAEWRVFFHSTYGMRSESEDSLDAAIDAARATLKQGATT